MENENEYKISFVTDIGIFYYNITAASLGAATYVATHNVKEKNPAHIYQIVVTPTASQTWKV